MSAPKLGSPSVQLKAMSDTDSHGISAGRRRPLHVVIYCWGAGILLVGLVGAVLIYVFAADDDGADAARALTAGRMYQHNIELMGGKLAVYADQFNQWFASLWQGRALAYTVAVLAVAIALMCFLAGRLMSAPLPQAPDEERKD